MTTVYGTTAGADAYHAARGNTGWTGTDPDKLASLLVASEYIDGKYRTAFPGEKTGLRSQEREWPRNGAYDIDGQPIAGDETPVEVVNATYEAALRDRVALGSLRTDVTIGTAIKSVSVEGAVSVEYAGVASAADMQVSIPAIDAILSPILVGFGQLSGLSGRRERV